MAQELSVKLFMLPLCIADMIFENVSFRDHIILQNNMVRLLNAHVLLCAFRFLRFRASWSWRTRQWVRGFPV